MTNLAAWREKASIISNELIISPCGEEFGEKMR